MTNAEPPSSRLDRIEAILLQTATRLDQMSVRLDDVTTQQAANTSAIAQLAENTNRVLARSAILDDVLLELRENAEEHRRNFEEHQRTTNAALQSLEAILVQLIRGRGQ